MGVLTNSNDGNGFVETRLVVETIRQLRREFPSFGGVYGWDYFDAGMGELDGGKEPWEWVKTIKGLSCAFFAWVCLTWGEGLRLIGCRCFIWLARKKGMGVLKESDYCGMYVKISTNQVLNYYHNKRQCESWICEVMLVLVFLEG